MAKRDYASERYTSRSRKYVGGRRADPAVTRAERLRRARQAVSVAIFELNRSGESPEARSAMQHLEWARDEIRKRLSPAGAPDEEWQPTTE